MLMVTSPSRLRTLTTPQVSYIGYKTERRSIGAQTSFRIELKDNSTFNTAVKTVVRKTKSNGMVIPEREISVAQQSLNMDEMQGLSFETAGEALQGQIAGLDIVSNSGNLGAGTSMRLRGVTSINGNQEPLIVVDGYILEDYDTDEFDANDMNEEKFATLLQVNPEDIQSINVLKDAAATAIWGSRGANGVIEIKTRRGSRGKTRVNFSYRFSGSWQPSGMKMLTGDEYKMMLQQAYHNPNPEAGNPADDIVELQDLSTYTAYLYNYNKNTDWVKEVTQFGQTHNYSLNVSGGGEKAQFRVSGSYDHETGSVIQQKLDRFTTRLALDYYVSDRIKFSSNFALTYTKQHKNNNDGLLSSAYNAMPNMSITRWEYDPATGYYDTGDYYIMPAASGTVGRIANNSNLSSKYLSDMVSNGNPVATAHNSWRQWSTYTITPQFSIEYKFLGKDDEETQLNYTGEVYLNAYTETKNYYYPSSLTTTKHNEGSGVNQTSNNEYKSLTFNTRHSLIFRPHFNNPDHSLQILGRFEIQTSNTTNQYMASSGISGGLSNPTVPGYITGLNTSTGKGHNAYATGSVHYSFGSKYSFDVTVRADGSTKFGSGHKWGIFPGVSARWNVSDENFWEPLRKVINMFAIRPGWGINGNCSAIGEGVIYNQYESYDSYNGTQAIRPSNLRLVDIRWEKTKSWNLGFNLNFFDDLLKFDLNIYNKKTTDLINSGVSVPSTSGFSSISSANIGSMTNQGWELFVNTGDILKFGKFHANLRFNISQNINKVTQMDASVLNTTNADFDYANGNELVMRRVQIGHSLGGIYGFRFKGVYAYDYKHNGYFLNPDDNEYYLTEPDANGNIYNTAKATGKTSPIVRDAEGNVVYDKNGNPLQMVYNYGGQNVKFEGGDVIYEDVNHDGQIDELDIVYLGSSNPKVNGGFGIDLTYGRWTLKTNFNFRIGNKIINLARMYAEDMRSNKNQSAAVNHRWRTNGQVTEIPRAMNQNVDNSTVFNALISDRYVEPGDYLRFQYFQIGYNFNPEKLKRYHLSSLRLAASGNNLIFWTKYKGVDPDHSTSGYSPCTDSSQTPRSRSFTVSLNIGF